MSDVLRVEVAFALAERQFLEQVELPGGATARQAVDASGLFEQFPEMRDLPAGVGIFGRRVELDCALSDGDRVEVYRPLLVDPKESRRRRAAARHHRERPAD